MHPTMSEKLVQHYADSQGIAPLIKAGVLSIEDLRSFDVSVVSNLSISKPRAGWFLTQKKLTPDNMRQIENIFVLRALTDFSLGIYFLANFATFDSFLGHFGQCNSEEEFKASVTAIRDEIMASKGGAEKAARSLTEWLSTCDESFRKEFLANYGVTSHEQTKLLPGLLSMMQPPAPPSSLAKEEPPVVFRESYPQRNAFFHPSAAAEAAAVPMTRREHEPLGNQASGNPRPRGYYYGNLNALENMRKKIGVLDGSGGSPFVQQEIVRPEDLPQLPPSYSGDRVRMLEIIGVYHGSDASSIFSEGDADFPSLADLPLLPPSYRHKKPSAGPVGEPLLPPAPAPGFS